MPFTKEEGWEMRGGVIAGPTFIANWTRTNKQPPRIVDANKERDVLAVRKSGTVALLPFTYVRDHPGCVSLVDTVSETAARQMGAFVLTLLVPPPPNRTVLVRTGNVMLFAALGNRGWVTVPKESPMQPPIEWFDRTIDSDTAEQQQESETDPAPAALSEGQMRFDF